ncbi:MAG TPA: hypothetical protein VFC86_09630, partial [Planctomycetota bacterium]|nr:hypothetical protein [Planctomycetota bacterium]
MNKALRLSSALLVVALVGCPVLGPWSEPVPLTELNSTFGDNGTCMSRDGLSVYFNSNRPGGIGSNDILVSRRADKTEPWGAPVNLGSAVNSSADDQGPTLSHDGRVLIFLSNRAGGFGEFDLYVSRRTDPEDDFGWGAPENLGSFVNTSEREQAPHLQKRGEDGNHTLYFSRGMPPDILSARVNNDGEVLGDATPL